MAAIDRAVERLALAIALLGGLVLIAVMLITVASVIGRALIGLGLRPVPGDYELVEAGTAFAVFAFLPLCQLRRGHVTVDLFLARAGRRANAAVDLLANLAMTAVAAVIAWRLHAGLLDKLAFGETTFILRFPLWWSYTAALVGAAAFVLVCAWSVTRSWRELVAPADRRG
jgi:TRAP-type C4-dicarboxylate transport system permease small subunit